MLVSNQFGVNREPLSWTIWILVINILLQLHGFYFLVVTDAEIAEILLKTFLEKDDLMNIAHDLFGNGSIFAPGKSFIYIDYHIFYVFVSFFIVLAITVPIWRPRRKIIAPTFSFKNLNQFVEVFYRQSNIMVEQLKHVAGKGTFSVWKYLTTYTMDSVCGKITYQLELNFNLL